MTPQRRHERTHATCPQLRVTRRRQGSRLRRSDGHPRLDARVGPRAGAAVARPELRLLRHHRHPRHDARAGARRDPVLAVRLDRRGHHRRAAARAGHDLQVRRHGHQPGRRQVGHRGRQQAGGPRGALPGPRPLHRDAGRTVHHGRRHRHQPGRHGVHQAGDGPRGGPGGPERATRRRSPPTASTSG